MNYYTFYDLAISPVVDQALLRKKFYQKSKEFHPDFYTLSDEETQAKVLEMSSLNNQAYKTLKDDDKRLKYFLELNGALAEEGKNQVPQDFLMEIMEINENLMELEFDDDPELSKKTAQMVADLEHQLQAQAKPLIENYQAGDELDQLRDFYLKQRYLLRIKEKIQLT